MNKRITSALIALTLLFSLISCGDTKQTTEAEAIEPTPLVIETVDEEEAISNPKPATVTIVTPCQDTQCWTGLMYINPDGEMTRVTLFDAVESIFDDNF